MIFGEEEAVIPKYYNDDEPKITEKTRFGRIRIISSNLNQEVHTKVKREQNSLVDILLKKLSAVND